MKFSIVRIDKQKTTHLTVKSAEWFFERIKTDTKAKDIGRLRKHIAEFGNQAKYDHSDEIALVFPSVEMKKSANGNLDIVSFNGLITLHIPQLLKREDVEAVKNASKMMPMTFAAFTGSDGRSVEILVSVKSIGGLVLQKEKEMDEFCNVAYETAFGAYSGILPKAIERQNVTAKYAFKMTLDEHPYVNPAHSSLSIGYFQKAENSSSSTPVNEQRDTDMNLYADYERMYERAVEKAYERTANLIEEEQYEAYLTQLSQELCKMGMPEEEAFLHIRNHHVYKKTYNEDTCRAIISAVYTEENQNRQKDYSEIGKETRRLIKFLTTRYVFRMNTVMGYTEYRPNNTWILEWQPCDENAIYGMTIEARLANLDVKEHDIRRYVRSNMIRQTDPVDEYFMKVRDKWDGKTDHIAMLAQAIPCNIPQWEKWFRKWFLYMVAQWLGRVQDFGNSIVPLLISSQGDGKSTFCQNLLPKELRWGYLANLDVNEKKQTLQAMHNFLLINLDEFNQIGPKIQEGFLKNVIQLPNVKMKRPYGKHVEDFKRMASFIATTNEVNVLSDSTGNRRFICVQLKAPINTKYKPNYEALYSQAYQLVMKGEQYWFNAEEIKEVMAHNRQYEIVPPAMMYFNEYYEVASNETEGKWTSPTAIYDHLRKIAGASLKANGVSAFGKYLKNIPGLQQKRINKGIFYLVREK